MILKHLNPQFDGLVPYVVGDRYYGQDMMRDFYSQISHVTSAIEGLVGYDTYLLSGGIVTEGSTKALIDISKLFAIIPGLIIFIFTLGIGLLFFTAGILIRDNIITIGTLISFIFYLFQFLNVQIVLTSKMQTQKCLVKFSNEAGSAFIASSDLL